MYYDTTTSYCISIPASGKKSLDSARVASNLLVAGVLGAATTTTRVRLQQISEYPLTTFYNCHDFKAILFKIVATLSEESSSTRLNFSNVNRTRDFKSVQYELANSPS